MTPHEIFIRFKQEFPNSREQYNPTEQNVIRWDWQIRELQKSKTPFGLSTKPILRKKAKPPVKFQRSRVTSFDQMPPHMREQYGEIASHFPGIQVWACGSRVAGDYVEQWDGDDVRALRAANFKPEKQQSDFDFWFLLTPTPIGDLPPWSDWVRGVIPETERIKIAMWDFTKLPETEFDAVIFAVQSNDVKTLVDIHNKFVLSPYNYCCELDGLVRWFQSAIDSGIIVASDPESNIGNVQKTDHQLG